MNKIKKLFNKLFSVNKAVKASFWFVVAGFLQRGISTISTPIFTRLMDTAEYGIYNVFMSWLEIFSVIITLRLYNGIYMKGLVTYKDDRDRFTSSLLGLTSFMSIIWFIIYLLFKQPINSLLKLSTPMMYCMFVLIITEAWFGFWSARERVDFDYKWLVIVTLLTSIAKPLFGILAVRSVESEKAYARILSMVIVEFVIYLILHISQLKKSKELFNKEYWKIAVQFHIVLIPHYLSQRILNHSDRIMIRSFQGESYAGIYSLAYSIAMIMGLFNTAFLNTLTPWNFKKLEEKNYTKMADIANIVVMIIALVNFALIVASPELLTFFAPKAYGEALYVIPPVSIGVFLMFVYGLFVNVEMYHNKNAYVMIASLIGALSNIALNFIFIPKYGYMAAAYTTMISYFIYCFMHMCFVKKIIKDNNIEHGIYDLKTISMIFVVLLLLGYAMIKLYPYPVIRYLIISILLIIVIIKRSFWLTPVKEILNRKVKKDE